MSMTCKFELSSRISNVYYSGEEIAGSITICSLKQRQIEAIILQFYGQSVVQWWELDKTKEYITHNDFSTQEVSDKTLYKHQQKHVCQQLQLASSSTYPQLQANVGYTFKFCFTIPKQVPATLHCLYGQTEYSLKLKLQHAKKVDKEFHQRIVVKNKLDLTQEIKYKEPCAVYRYNEFGQIKLHVPCSGFTPGQNIPYYVKYQATRNDCKLLIQLNCFTTCRTHTNCNKFKQFKHIVQYAKHLSTDCTSHINIPLKSQISSPKNSELILSTTYALEAILIDSHNKALLTAEIILTVGTTPCCRLDVDRGVFQNYMCFDNLGSSIMELEQNFIAANISYGSYTAADDFFKSLYILPTKPKTQLRKSLRCCYKKLIKLI